MDSDFIGRVEDFSKKTLARKRKSQFDALKEKIEYLVSMNIFSYKDILDFLFEEDKELKKKYKDREKTAYDLLRRYIHTHFKDDTQPKKSKATTSKSIEVKNETLGTVEPAPEHKESTTEVVKSAINKSDDDISDEMKKTLDEHYDKVYINAVGYRVALTMYEMKMANTT